MLSKYLSYKECIENVKILVLIMFISVQGGSTLTIYNFNIQFNIML